MDQETGQPISDLNYLELISPLRAPQKTCATAMKDGYLWIWMLPWQVGMVPGQIPVPLKSNQVNDGEVPVIMCQCHASNVDMSGAMILEGCPLVI